MREGARFFSLFSSAANVFDAFRKQRFFLFNIQVDAYVIGSLGWALKQNPYGTC